MLEELQWAMQEVEEESDYDGYIFRMQDVLILMVLGLLCDNKTIANIFEWSQSRPVQDFLKREFGIAQTPKRTQFYKILSYVKHEQFAISFQKWAEYFFHQSLAGQCIAIDGKSINSTAKQGNRSHALHIASAVLTGRGIIVSSKECTHEKSCEIGAFREIIESLNVTDALILSDALHCKTKSAEVVISNGADYLFIVKDNNKNLRQNLELLSKNRATDTAYIIEKNGGRIETRTAYVSNNLDCFCDKDKWKNLSIVGSIHREVEVKGNVIDEWHYYISNKQLSAIELLENARLEWKIESMHCAHDIHFYKDKTKVRDMEVEKI